METGVTTFMLKHEIDTGNIILQEKIPIDEDENVGSVHDRLMALGTDLVLHTVNLIEQSDLNGTPLPTTPQENIDAGLLRPAPKIFKETCEIDTTKTVREVHNFVRGLSPYPAAWCNLTIGSTTYENVKVFATEPGEGLITLPCADGLISLTELQLPGKKRMKAKDLLNGLR